MEWFRLQPSSIPLLAESILAFFFTMYLFSLRNKSRAARLLTVSLAVLSGFLFSFFITNSLVAGAWQYFSSASYALALLSLFLLLQFAYHFLGNPFSREARMVARGCGMIQVILTSILIYQLIGFGSVATTLLLVIGTTMLLTTIWTIAVFLRKAVVFADGETAYHPSRGKAGEGWSSRLTRGMTLILRPHHSRAVGNRAFAVVLSLAMVMTLAGTLRDLGFITESLFNNVLFFLMMAFLLGLVIAFVNHAQEPVSFQVKLTGLSLAAILAVLGTVGLLVYQPADLARESGNTVPERQTLRFTPDERGGYNLSTSPAVFYDEHGEDLNLKDGEWHVVNLGFAFPFGGKTWEQITISDNSMIELGKSSGNPVSRELFDFSRDIAASFRQNDRPKMAPFLSRLDATFDGSVRLVHREGMVVLTWNRVPDYLKRARNTFQVVLRETGEIAFSYREIQSELRWGGIGIWPGGASPPVRHLDLSVDLPVTLAPGEAVVDDFLGRYRALAHHHVSTLAWLILFSTVFVVLVFPVVFHFTLVRPLSSLVGALRRVNEGDLGVQVDVHVEDEIGYLAHSFNRVVRTLKLDEEKLKEYAVSLEQQVDERTTELKESLLHLTAAQQQILELERQKTQFFTNISHELRTPLPLILGPVEDTLTDWSENLPSEVIRELSLVLRSGKKLHQLIDQLLDLSRIDVGRLELRIRNYDIVDFLETVVASFIPLAERQGIDMELTTGSRQIPVAFDSEHMEKVVSNLLSNALKFTHRGGRITIDLFETDAFVEILVTDTGPGIPDQDIEFIFNRFYQAKTGHQRVHAGTGIGLSLSKELVELHGGDIRVENRKTGGCTFTVRLPRRHDSAGEDLTCDYELAGSAPYTSLDSETDVQPEAGYVLPGNVPTILVVDDNADIRRYLSANLSRMYHVRLAANGTEALEVARMNPPHLVVADVMMPEMDGFELCKAIRSDETLMHIPVILLTAKASDAAKIEGLQHGADDYVFKPFNMEELLARIENLIEIRRLLREQFGQRFIVQPSEIEVESADQRLIEKVREIVEANIGNTEFSVEWLADEVGMSARQLQRRLRATTRLSAAGFIRTLRLQRAASLIRQAWGSVSEIAYEVGFRDASHFSRLFRQVYGVSPTEYQADPLKQTTGRPIQLD